MKRLIEFRNVSYVIGERWILRDVNIAVDSGETVVLLGRSGSGKTTLLKMVNALLTPTSGEVSFDGKPVKGWDPIQLRRRIGYVIQDAGLFPHFNVKRNIELVPQLENWPLGKMSRRTASLLELMGLNPSEYAERFPRQLSGGQRQRVGIARALAADPPLLLLDEPFAALDPITRFELQQQFLQLRREMGKSALFVTHDVREAVMMGSRIVLLKDGLVEFDGEPDAFLQSSGDESKAFLRTLEAR